MTSQDECLYVDVDNTLAAAIVYLAAIADPADTRKRERSMLALRAWCARHWRRTEQDRDPYIASAISVVINSMTERDMRGALNKLNRKVFERVNIAAAATKLAFLQNAYDDVPIPADVQSRSRRELIFGHKLSSERAADLTAKTRLLYKPFTLNTLAKQSGMSPGKFKDTQWKESLPVLHLAWALRSQILAMDLRSYDVLRLLLSHGRWVKPAMEGAEIHLPRIAELHDAFARYATMRRVRLLMHCAVLGTTARENMP